MLKVKDQSAQAQPKKYYTAEEYLALEELAEFKNEYRQGEIHAMSLEDVDHNRIVGNLLARLNRAFHTTKYEVFMLRLRLWVESKIFFTYPDIMVIFDKPLFYEDRDDTITNPFLIAEVLSNSTQSYDRGKKFEFYRGIPTLREYILIDQHRIHVEQFSLGADGKWTLVEYKSADDILRCTSVDFQIPLREIYHKVEFENE